MILCDIDFMCFYHQEQLEPANTRTDGFKSSHLFSISNCVFLFQKKKHPWPCPGQAGPHQAARQQDQHQCDERGEGADTGGKGSILEKRRQFTSSEGPYCCRVQ